MQPYILPAVDSIDFKKALFHYQIDNTLSKKKVKEVLGYVLTLNHEELALNLFLINQHWLYESVKSSIKKNNCHMQNISTFFGV